MRWTAQTEERRTVDAIIDALAAGGVEFVVGMPGGLTVRLWAALHDHPNIRPILVREESLGSYLAEAYGRLTGRPMVVMGQGEWIVGNAGQGYLEAHLGCSPMVILTEMSDGGAFSHHAPYQSGTGDYGTWDARGGLAAVTKRVMVSNFPSQAVQHTQLAIKHATTGEPGPVAVVFHSNALRGSVGPASQPRIYSTGAYLPRRSGAVDTAGVAEVAEVLRTSHRPVILAGNGVRVGQACDSVASLARRLDAPVVTTPGGKGVFPETDPSAGGVIGPFGWPSANAILGDADVVLAVGTKLGAGDTVEANPALLDPERQTLIQVDVEPLNASWTIPMDHTLVGDAELVMDELRQALDAGPAAAARSAAPARVAEAAADTSDPVPAWSDDLPMHPRHVITIMQDHVPADAIVTCDAGENRLFMLQWFRSNGGGRYLQPAAGGGMGYAVPAAMGAKLARPDLPVLAVCGDGGFSMVLHGLMSAIEEDLPIGVLVLNNDALGWVLHGSGEHPVAATFHSFDLAAVARSLGCEGIRVSGADDLRSALGKLPGITRPLVIDVPTSLEVSYKDVLQRLGEARRATGY